MSVFIPYIINFIFANGIRHCDPCEFRFPWAPVEKELNSDKSDYSIYHYKLSSGKPLSTFLGVQAERLGPGATVESQESQSYLYHCYEGKGRTELVTPTGETMTFKWEARDTFAVPSWCKIKHINESTTEQAYLAACHDGPFLECLGIQRRNE